MYGLREAGDFALEKEKEYARLELAVVLTRCSNQVVLTSVFTRCKDRIQFFD